MAEEHRSSLPILITICLLRLLFIQTFQNVQSDSIRTTSLKTDCEITRRACREDSEKRKADCYQRGLDSVPQNLSGDTADLDLSGNNLTLLTNSSFKRYRLITRLDLSLNDIRVIEPAAFHPLKNLVKLDMTNNRNLVLPPTGLFRWANKLSYVMLAASNLKSIPNDTLKWTQNLDFLDVGFNHLTFINISSCGTVGTAFFDDNSIEHLTTDVFTFVCQTDHLQLGGNPIRSIDPVAIASLQTRILSLGSYPFTSELLRNLSMGISRSEIEELRITFIELSHFPEDVLAPLRGYPFTALDFSNNKLTTLYPFVFSNLTLLGQLSLQGNKITTIEPNFFEGMQALKVLNVKLNKISSVNSDNDTWTVDLIELHLSWNSLTEISEFSLKGLKNLTFLDLSYNRQLFCLKLTSFTGLDNIQVIDLSRCGIGCLELYTPVLKSLDMERNYPARLLWWNPLTPGKSFRYSRNLIHLDLQDSQLQISNLGGSTVSLFDGLCNLTTLDLSRNYLGNLGLTHGIFSHLSALQELSLDACGILSLHPLVFSGLESLQKLNLSGNNIEYLPIGVLSGLGLMKSIKLDGNILRYLDEGTFSNNTQLTRISLANNKLTGLNQSTFEPIYSSLLFLDLSMNPIICTCELEWLLDWVNRTIDLINEKQTLCGLASFSSLREKPLLDFNPTELCRHNYAIFSLIPIAVVCLVVIIVLVYHYRWQLRYKIFLMKLAVIGYRQRQDARDHNDYETDVNVIVYDDDEGWIREHLRPALEDRLPQFQRNIFGDEDLMWGMHYLDAVDYAVSTSYKTIIVLSRAAVRDRWFMLYFRIAMDHVSDTQTEFVVVVFLEDIPDDEIPFLARVYLRDGRPYLYWTEDVRGQEYFWNELVKNLTINLITNDLIPNE